MTFNPNADVSKNKAQRRGRTAAVAGGGVVGLGAIAILVLNLLTGQDFSAFLSPTDNSAWESTSGESGSVENCDTGADANANIDCRIAASSLALDEFWATQVEGYVEPTLVIVDQATSTDCGTASNAVGPFYCPPEQTVYIEPTFFELMRDQFGASAQELAQLYVTAHEYGHHIQNIVGTMAEHPSRATGPASDSVRLELQADCYAGGWIAAMSEQTDDEGRPYLEAPTDAQISDALNAAAAVGDDHIQSQAGGVNAEQWTHGSSEQRERWFMAGYSGGIGACDTFMVTADDL